MPVSRAARRLGGDALKHALSDGEDYELLFTVRPGRAESLKGRWPSGARLTEIGAVTGRGSGLWLLRGGKKRRLRPAGWEHLR